MSWFVGNVIASFAAAYLVVCIFDYLTHGVASGLASVVRAILFVASWTAVAAASGMRDFTKLVQRLRLRVSGVNRV